MAENNDKGRKGKDMLSENNTLMPDYSFDKPHSEADCVQSENTLDQESALFLENVSDAGQAEVLKEETADDVQDVATVSGAAMFAGN